MKNKIPFNKPYLTGKEVHYIYQAVYSGKISGNGEFTRKCHDFFDKTFGFRHCLLTNSCTDALEMAAILAGIESGDEVIVPSYTFVSTANAFVLRGARIVFADSQADHPGIDVTHLESLITPKTKAIVPVHYAGVACDMDAIMALADKHNLFVIEDAAQAIDSYYIDKNGARKPLGGIGHMATFSFHETKNIISGEGGMLVVSDPELVARAEIVWEKGTNRSAFFRGEVDKYTWVDMGSSFLPSEVTAGFLYAQLEHLTPIQERRRALWERYYEQLQIDAILAKGVQLPHVPAHATNNAHMFYLVCDSLSQRTALIAKLKEVGVWSVFHYISLHRSDYSIAQGNAGGDLKNSDKYTECLVRLPLFYELEEAQVDFICKTIIDFMQAWPVAK